MRRSVITGKTSQRGKRLRSVDGLSWRERNRDAINRRRRKLYALDHAKHLAYAAGYRRREYAKVLAANRAWGIKTRAKLRAEMIKAYGGKCRCCGEREPKFLQLDHIHNDGHIDRKINKTTAQSWARLKRAGWPKDRLQLLCANCNFGKRMNGGVCPHAKDR